MRLFPSQKVALKLLLAVGGLAASHTAFGLSAMSDKQMSDISGTGIAVALDDIRMAAGPTSFVELTGTDTTSGLFDRGDLRWYGLTLSGTDGTSSWAGGCGEGILGLGCSRGGTVGDLAPHDNPMLLRVFGYNRVNFQGNMEDRTVLELLWPSDHEPYRFSFWGEMIADNNESDPLQIQNIFNNIEQGGTKIRLFQHSDDGDPTFGLIYENHFAADVRFSANQTLESPDTYGQIPEFSDREGLYLQDYRVRLALGQMHYQSLILDSADSKGNFTIEQTRIPDQAAIYNDFYARDSGDDPTGGYDRSVHSNYTDPDYQDTHGFVRWGDWVADPVYDYSTYADAPPAENARADDRVEAIGGQCMTDRSSCSKNAPTDTSGGMFFVSRTGNTFQAEVGGNYFDDGPNQGVGTTPTIAPQSVSAVNLGDSRIEGMLIQHMKITTLGAGN